MKNETKTMHLFAGIGGGLLADLILGHQPVVAVEWDAYACKVLRERAADGWFPGLSVWEGDVRLFDPSEYTGVVDCIHAGFPCQDISVAGKQAGVSEGTRSGLYREVLRIAGVVRPKQLFLENVSAILSNGLGTVLGDLAAMGYDTRWLCIRASDVGAPHHRDRWFLLANSDNAERQARSSDGMGEVQSAKASSCAGSDELLSDANNDRCRDGVSSSCDKEGDLLANAASARFSQRGCTGQPESNSQGCAGMEREPERCCEDLADSDNQRREELNTPGIAAVPGWDGGCVDARWSAGWWTTEPALGRVAHGVPNRVGQLKGYGNAQVPIQAATAYRLLGGL